jgi:AraC-like DNA-binding protein
MTRDPTGHGASAQTQWAGKATLGPGWALFAGHAGDNRPHRHHALQLAIGRDGTTRVDVEGQTIESAGLLIASDVQHSLHPGEVTLLYVERESTAGRRLAAACRDGVLRVTAEAAATLQANWQTPAPSHHAVDALVQVLDPGGSDFPFESASSTRVRAVIAALHARPAEDWTLAAMASAASLSPSRFGHAFQSQVGLAVRPYLRWLRLAHALEAAGGGYSLTDAAHRAGFADAAHFTRTMRRHFGVAPSSILASLRAAS